MITAKRPIIFFDGVCNLCNRWVQWVIRHDKREIFLFSPLQSARGQDAVAALAAQTPSTPDSVVLYYMGKYYTQSTAVIKIITLLGGVGRIGGLAWIMPSFLRNALYRWIARHRYKWFGKKDACMVPTPELAKRFI